MKFDLEAVTLEGVGRALVRLLDAGIARGRDASDDPVIFRDGYYRELKGLPNGALELAVQEVIRQAPKFLPPAGELAALTRTLIPKSRAVAPRREVKQIERVRGEDELGPLTRYWQEGEESPMPEPTDPTVTCPTEGCRCPALFVWAPAAMFGGASTAYGARWVWQHVATANDLKRTTEWNPYKDR